MWWQPSLAFRTEGIASQISGRAPVFGVAMLVLTAAVLAVAVRPLRSRRLAALAAISLLASVAVLITYSGIPVNNLGRRDQNYLLIVLLPVGLLAWLTVGAAAVLAARRVAGRDHGLAAGRWGVRVIALAAVALIGLGSWLAVAQQARLSAIATSARELSATRLAAERIEQLLPRQRLEMTVLSGGRYERNVTLGVAWELYADGYQPAVNHRAARYLGPRYLFRGQRIPDVTVVMRQRGIVVRHARLGQAIKAQ